MTDKKLSAAASAISEDLQKALDVVDKEGKASTGSDIYYAHGEKAGFVKEVIDGVKSHDRTFMAGVMDATSALGLKALKSNKDLTKVEVTVGGAKHEDFTVTYRPVTNGEIPGKDGQPGKPWTSYGGLRGVHKTTTQTKGGDIGAAMELASVAAEKALTKAK